MQARPFHLGVVMLDSRFPRLPGDIGNPDSFAFPVSYRRVDGATVGRIVSAEAPPQELIDSILEAARELEAEGADLIATSCGFLGGLQSQLRSAVGLPVLASSLTVLPYLRTLHGAETPLGVLTFDSRSLRPAHFGAAYSEPLVIEGLERGAALYPAIAEDRPELDPIAACEDALAAARRLREAAPDLAAVVLECTNLAPYRAEIARELALPVYDLNSLIAWQAEALSLSRGNPYTARR